MLWVSVRALRLSSALQGSDFSPLELWWKAYINPSCLHTHTPTHRRHVVTNRALSQCTEEARSEKEKWPEVYTHTSTYTPLIPSDFQIELECRLTSVQLCVCVCLETITWHASPLLPKNQEAPYRSCHHLPLSLYCLFSCRCFPPTFKAHSFFV